MKNIDIPKFWLVPQTVPPTSPIFLGHELKIKILLPTCFALSSHFQKGMAIIPWVEIDLSETASLGVKV